MNPVVVARSEMERCLIEPTINSVRVSIKIKQVDEIEEILWYVCLVLPFFVFFVFFTIYIYVDSAYSRNTDHL